MSSSYRPRRTRIYGANYDIGESYYKKQLQDLDYKRDPLARQRRELSCDDAFLRGGPKVSFSSAPDENDDLLRFSRPHKFQSAYIDNGDDAEELYAGLKRREDKFFKQKSPTPSFESKAKGLKARFFDEENIAESVAPARRSKFRSLIEDNDDEAFTLPPRKSRFRNLIEDNDDDITASLPPRKSKFRSLLDETSNGFDNDTSAASVVVSKRVSKFKQTFDSEDSAESKAASSRAARTRARLADLESEMDNISLKQNEREKRSLNLRKLLRDSESADVTL